MQKKVKQGFSLIELMVVMVIIGVLSTMVIFYVNQDRTQQLNFEGIGERFINILQYAKSRSIYGQAPLALMVSLEGFHFMQQKHDEQNHHGFWQVIDDPILKDIRISKAIKIDVDSHSTLIIKDKQALTVVDPNGIIAPFSIQFSQNQKTISVVGDKNGQISIKRL